MSSSIFFEIFFEKLQREYPLEITHTQKHKIEIWAA